MEKVMFYDHETRKLSSSIWAKARRLVRLGKVRRVGENMWAVLPIKGYNTRTYIVERVFGGWDCNCQSKAAMCSHALACWLFENSKKEWGGNA